MRGIDMKKRQNLVKKMRSYFPVVVLFLTTLLLTSTGQSLGIVLQQKDLAFPQIVVGPSVETVICLTNRGVAGYRGRIEFWRGSDPDWNPVVNGTRVFGSGLDIFVDSKMTEVFIVKDDLSAAGAAVILADDSSQDNFIEGNLTYSIGGHTNDSVGISPSVELYQSTIPFEDFDTVGLALANANNHQRAEVTIRLVDDQGEEREDVFRSLSPRYHQATFLSELFSTEVGTGKIELESDIPILCTAVTLDRGEISALPVLPSPVAYNFRFRYLGITNHAEATIWAEGVFVKGYLRYLELNGKNPLNSTTYFVTGTLANGVLRLTHFGAGPEVGGIETINSLRLEGFSFNRRYFTGTFTRTFPWLFNPLGQMIGTYELIRQD